MEWTEQARRWSVKVHIAWQRKGFEMRTVKEWKVDLILGENDGRSYAEARLVTDVGDRLVGVGYAQVAPEDYDVPEIGDEIAVARALTDLGRRLLDTASQDVEGVTGEILHLTR